MWTNKNRGRYDRSKLRYPQAASAHDTFWDFASLMPESMHMLVWVMSDRAIPRSLRMIEGFGKATFSSPRYGRYIHPCRS